MVLSPGDDTPPLRYTDHSNREYLVKARIKWIENVAFMGETESGHSLVMDGSPDAGGRNLGPRPMETVLLGTGACSAFDVIHILRKGREEITDCVVELTAERAHANPKVFTAIHFHYVVSGISLNPAKVERAIKLSAEVYCSASAMMAKTARISHDFEIHDASEKAPAKA
jgi:putative redox protein